MKKLILFAIIAAAAIGAPFAANQWQVFVERQHDCQQKLSAEKARVAAEEARQQAVNRAAFNSAVNQTFAQCALGR